MFGIGRINIIEMSILPKAVDSVQFLSFSNDLLHRTGTDILIINILNLQESLLHMCCHGGQNQYWLIKGDSLLIFCLLCYEIQSHFHSIYGIYFSELAFC